jgi:hypothetical protein
MQRGRRRHCERPYQRRFRERFDVQVGLGLYLLGVQYVLRVWDPEDLTILTCSCRPHGLHLRRSVPEREQHVGVHVEQQHHP